MPEQDRIDELVSQWAHVRPDLELGPMVTLGLLARLHANLLRAVEAVFSDHTLQVGEFDVLATLRRVGEPYAVKPTTLARQLMLSPAGMTSRLDRLEARGLIERRPAPDDRRSTSVLLTKDGFAVIDAAVTDHVANEARLVSALSATEQRTLDGLLRKLLDQFEGRPPPPS